MRARASARATKKPPQRAASCSNQQCSSLLRAWCRRCARSATHAFSYDADLFHAGALGRVDDLDDVAVTQVGRAIDEHRLVFTLLINGAKSLFELHDGHV